MLRALMMAILACVAIAVPSAADAQVRIVIDPGHGGSDPGGVGTGMQEKNVVLDVSARFKTLLDADTADNAGGGKWTALMTRSNDVFVSLAGRAAYSNNQNADRFMSIHSNAFGDPSANGTETFSLTNAGTGAALRNLVQAEMIAAWGLTNRGNKTANFAVLRDTAAPAVLHELAFITNATDAAKLGSPAERQKAAVAHLRAIQRHYNLAPYVPGANPPPPPPTDTAGEIAGRVIDDQGPVVGAEVAIEGGARVLTDAEGAFVFSEVPAGTQTVSASAEGHEAKTVSVDVVAAARAELDIELVRLRTGEPEPEPAEVGGCSTGGATGGSLLALALLGLLRRRRA